MEFLYTWKDAERKIKLYFAKKQVSYVADIDVYPTELVVVLNKPNMEEKVKEIFFDIFGKNYSESENRLYMDKFDDHLDIDIELDTEAKSGGVVKPFFKDVIYRDTVYDKKLFSGTQLKKCPVIAFHSYKGGVGRTLSLLAFAKAWSNNKPEDKLLIIDSDIEAPGITWLIQQELDEMGDSERFSYLDLLELIQNGQINKRKIMDNVVELIQETTMSVNTGKVKAEHFVLPTYRYEEQFLDIYSSPESIAAGYHSRYILAEVLSEIGHKVGVAAVLVDLRAGVSEFSAPLIFDQRVKKYIVTSTSFQSVQGTKTLLKLICRGLPVSENGILPEIFLTMGTDEVNTTLIKSELVREYDNSDDNSNLDEIFTELPFASELVHLISLQQIFRKLEGRYFYININNIIVDRYMGDDKREKEISDRKSVVKKIHQLAECQITAEGNSEFSILLTDAIKNLIKRYLDDIPQAVILGAKGAGKTFLYKEMLSKKTWQEFIKSFVNTKKTVQKTYILPLVTPRNIDDMTQKYIQETVSHFSSHVAISGCNKTYWHESHSLIERFMRDPHGKDEWKQFWLARIADAFQENLDMDMIDEELQKNNQRVLFLADGLEEWFERTFENEGERSAIQALVQDVINELKIKYRNIGLLIFLRKDSASNSITTNYTQFQNQYRSIALNWSHEEALKLALWLVLKAAPEFCDDVDVDNITMEESEKKLNRLWGLKLGKNSSNEAYSSRWILAALSDFNSQLQARDIIRFLEKATLNTGNAIYKDRYIMPKEIKNAVQECSKEKITEIKQEIVALRPILEELENAPVEKRILPFNSDTFNWGANNEKLLKQEGLLIIDNDKYYLPEIIRHALGFKYVKGARPKVLALLLKK